jgi:hypothetical protein
MPRHSARLTNWRAGLRTRTALASTNSLDLQGISCYISCGEDEWTISMKSRLLSRFLVCLSILFFSAVSTHSQTVVTFDDLHETGSGSYLVNTYQGLSWSNFAVLNAVLSPSVYGLNGYYYGMVSSSNVAVNGIGNPAEIDSLSNFNFLSVYLTGAYNSNLNIEVQGFSGATLLYDTTVVASATSPTLFTFDYLDVSRLYFSNSGGQPAFATPSAPQFVMDNFAFEFVPEPSSLLLTGLGAVTLWAFLKRRRADDNLQRHCDHSGRQL